MRAESPRQPLRADQRIAGRSFSDPCHTERDLATLTRLRDSLRRVAGGGRAGALRFADEIGVHHVVVPDWEALEARQPVALIGFFGQAREDVDHSAIVALEDDIVSRASGFPGLLAYHNACLGPGRWGNLVVFASHAETAAVAGDPAHLSAVAGTPRHYASLRLHRGAFADGCLGAAAAVIRETLYLDFGASPAWRALRVYGRGAEGPASG
jgi:hypothetical protein